MSSSILDDREAYKNNPYWEDYTPITGDFTPFYVIISICSIIGGVIIILNVAFCFCSQYRHYWRDRNTGNRWVQSLWTVTPHNNPPLDLSELEKASQIYKQTVAVDDSVQYHSEESEIRLHHQPQQYMELQKRESDI